ncbi:MAG: nucleotidyltransferase domain-containing protein [Candidatus Pacearchaeota archaeon]
MKKQFYDLWRNKSELENAGIQNLKLSKKLILENIPSNEIVSIYVKGSFVRREMVSKSDIDIITVLKTKKHFGKIKKLDKWGERSNLKPYPQFLGYSLWELKTGKRIKNNIGGASPSRMVKHLKEYKLIYGRDLVKENLFTRTDEEDLEKLANVFRKEFIPQYERGNFSFGMLIKQTFWLIENEQKVKGKNPPHQWKKLRDSIKDRNHIIYDAWRLREIPSKDKAIRKEYVNKLKKYIKKNRRLLE